ncbi:MAG: Uncharacterised protein [Polaribacter sp. SA4-10]|nr:MAG: Uncharacterised protein [Polaribacter sp. SA4-10]
MKIIKKPYVEIFFASLMLFSSCNGEQLFQENEFETFTKVSYKEMMYNLKNDIDSVVLESKPESISLENYKIKLLNGELEMSEKQINKISFFSEKLSNYGKFLAQKNNIDIDVNNKSSTIALGGLYSPEDNMETKYKKLKINSEESLQSRMNPWLECALIALGADALWALGGSAASAWTAAAMTRAFTAVAKRFLGPIGVAIAIVSFGICMAGNADNS